MATRAEAGFALGIPATQLSYKDVFERATRDFNILESMNTLGPSLKALGMTNSTAGASGPGAPGYEQRTGGTVGSLYSKVVGLLSSKINPATVNQKGTTRLSATSCAVELREYLYSGGLTNYYPRVADAKELRTALKSPAFVKYWDEVSASDPNSWNSVPNGSVAVWDDVAHGGLGTTHGHVGVIFHKDGQTYLLGNTASEAVVLLKDGSFHQSNAKFFLPKIGQ